MTDAELGEYIAPDETPEDRAKLVASLKPGQREVFERMHQVEGELMLWEAGLGPRPTGVIICGPREIRGAGK